ncbi:MAG: hypothetical protein JWR08_2625 [Enterovirga sp.]|nr:hypothetical protein [Enterovirga sp.]
MDKIKDWLRPLKPDLSGPGIRRLTVRGGIAVIMVAILVALADWSARGFLDRGGLDRLVATRAHPEPPPRAAPKPDRALDRARLKAVLAGAER